MAAFPLPPPMRRALDLAAVAAEAGEVPVGAVVTLDGEIVAEARNAMRGTLDPTAHAEIVAIRHAATRLGRARLARDGKGRAAALGQPRGSWSYEGQRSASRAHRARS